MKKLILSTVALIAFMGASAQNVKSIDFENGDIKGWFVWKTMPNVKVVTEDVYAGEFALRVAGGADVDVKLEPGKYDISAYAKLVSGESANAKFIIKTHESRSSYKFVNVDYVEVSNDTKYEKLSINVNVKSAGVYKIALQGAKGAVFMIDNISVTKR